MAENLESYNHIFITESQKCVGIQTRGSKYNYLWILFKKINPMSVLQYFRTF